MTDKEITLKLNVQKVNIILQALTKLPWEFVHELIPDIKRQGDEQVKVELKNE